MECVDLSPEELTQIWDVKCRTPHGVRGFKFEKSTYEPKLNSRTPHGVRGFKCQSRAS